MCVRLSVNKVDSYKENEKTDLNLSAQNKLLDRFQFGKYSQ